MRERERERERERKREREYQVLSSCVISSMTVDTGSIPALGIIFPGIKIHVTEKSHRGRGKEGGRKNRSTSSLALDSYKQITRT